MPGSPATRGWAGATHDRCRHACPRIKPDEPHVQAGRTHLGGPTQTASDACSNTSSTPPGRPGCGAVPTPGLCGTHLAGLRLGFCFPDVAWLSRLADALLNRDRGGLLGQRALGLFFCRCSGSGHPAGELKHAIHTAFSGVGWQFRWVLATRTQARWAEDGRSTCGTGCSNY